MQSPPQCTTDTHVQPKQTMHTCRTILAVPRCDSRF